jgi:hypothetical protein
VKGAQAIGHLLREVSRSGESFCKVAGREGCGKARGQQAPEVAGVAEEVALQDAEEAALDDDPSPSPPCTAPLLLANLLLLREEDLEREVAVRQESRQADELLEHILDPAADRRPSSPQHASLRAVDAHDPLLARDGMDETNEMIVEKAPELLSDRREAPGLDLHEEVAAHDVDLAPVYGDLDPVARARVPRLERGMERALVERGDGALGRGRFRGHARTRPNIAHGRRGRQCTRYPIRPFGRGEPSSRDDPRPSASESRLPRPHHREHVVGLLRPAEHAVGDHHPGPESFSTESRVTNIESAKLEPVSDWQSVQWHAYRVIGSSRSA